MIYLNLPQYTIQYPSIFYINISIFWIVSIKFEKIDVKVPFRL